MSRRLSIFINLLILLALLQALGLVQHRGAHVAGYELLAPAVGFTTLAEEGLLRGFSTLLQRADDFGWWNPTHSILFTFIPGLLQFISPSLFWVHVVSALLWSIGWLLLSRSTKTPAILYLGIVLACSPATLTYVLVGYPYVSGVLPYFLAIAWVLSSKRRQLATHWVRFSSDAAVFFLIQVLSFHCYEMGKTWAVVLIAGALTLPGVSFRERFWWMLIALSSAFHVGAFGRNNVDYVLADIGREVPRLFEALTRTTSQLLFSSSSDSPVPLWLALGMLPFLPKRRGFYAAILAAQAALLVLGNMQTDTLLFPKDGIIPRRILLLQGFSAIVIAEFVWSRRHAATLHHALRLVTIATFVSASINFEFLLAPREQRALPYLTSPIDYVIDRSVIDASLRLFETIRETPGRHLIVYELDSLQENMGDPQGIPERLILSSRYASIRGRVTFLTYRACRYWCFASWMRKPVEELWSASSATANERTPVFVHLFKRQPIPRLITELSERNALVLERESPLFTTFRSMIAPEGPLVIAPATEKIPSIRPASSTACLQVYRPVAFSRLMLEPRVLDPRAERFTTQLPLHLPIPAPLSFRISARIVNYAATSQPVRIALSSADEGFIVLSRRLLWSSGPGERSATERSWEVVLEPGSHDLTIYLSNVAPGSASLDINLSNKIDLQVSCQGQREFDASWLGTESTTMRTLPRPSEVALVRGSACLRRSGVNSIVSFPSLLTFKRRGSAEIHGTLVPSSKQSELVLFDLVNEESVSLSLAGKRRLSQRRSEDQARQRSTSALINDETRFVVHYSNRRRTGILRLKAYGPTGNLIFSTCASALRPPASPGSP